MQSPHLFVGSVGVQRTAIRGRHDQRQRIRAAALIHVLKSIAQLRVRLEVIKQAWISVYFGEAKPQSRTNDNYA